MNDKRFIQTLSLTGLLSYATWQEISLEPLNILIGPNASGKSNLIEVLRLLQATPSDLSLPIRLGGGFAEWVWKGQPVATQPAIEVQVSCSPDVTRSLRHYIGFKWPHNKLSLAKEEITEANPSTKENERSDSSFYHSQKREVLTGAMQVNGAGEVGFGRIQRQLMEEKVKSDQSILSLLTDGYTYPELTALARHFAAIKFYTDWNLGRYAALRQPQKVDDPNDFLLEDASNLALILNDLLYRGYRLQLIEDLQNLYE